MIWSKLTSSTMIETDTKEIFLKEKIGLLNEDKNFSNCGRGGRWISYGLNGLLLPKKLGSRPHYLVINADESEPGTVKIEIY